MKSKTKKARISKGLFYRPTLKLTTGLYKYASQYDSTSAFPDWKIGEKNRSVTLINADKNKSLFLSNISIRYTKEVIDESSNILFNNLGNDDLKSINNEYVKEFDIKVTKSAIVEFQEIIELDVDYEDIVSMIKNTFLNKDLPSLSKQFTSFSNVSYTADFKDKEENMLSVLVGPANKQELRGYYANHIIDEKKEKDLIIGDNNLYLRCSIRRTDNNGIKIDDPAVELSNFEQELLKVRNQIISKVKNAG